MKYPKLKQRVLCQLTVGLPIILLILIPLLLVLLAGVTVWVFIGGLVLACVYLFCNISTLFFLDIALSTVHSQTAPPAMKSHTPFFPAAGHGERSFRGRAMTICFSISTSLLL